MPAKPISWRTHYSLGILTLVVMFNAIDRQLIGAVLEPIKNEFRATDTQMGWVAGLWFAFFYAAASVPIARLADQGNRSRILAICCALWSSMTILCGLVLSFWQLVLARMAVAICEAGSAPAALAMVADYYPKEQRPMAMSVMTTGSYLATLFATAGGAWIAARYGWRMAFIVAGLPGIALALLMWVTVTEPRRGAWDSAPPAVQGPLMETLRRLLSSAAFRNITIANGCATCWLIGMSTWNISFLIRSHGLTLERAGLLAGTLLPVSMIAGVLLSGWLSTRLIERDPRWQLGIPLLGSGATIAASLAYFLWPSGMRMQVIGWDIPQAMIFFALMGFFCSWIFASSVAALSNVIPAQQRAVANAVYVVFYTLFGLGLGPVAVGMMSDALILFAGKDGLRLALIVLTSAMALSMLFYARAIKPYLEAGQATAACRIEALSNHKDPG